MMMRRIFWVLLLCLSFGIKDLQALSENPQIGQWVTDGTVNAVVKDATTGITFIGGDYSLAGKYYGGGIFFNQTDGVVDTSVSNSSYLFNGPVSAIISDGGTGWYVGGSFTKVAGTTVSNLVHLRADMTVDTSWTPQIVGADARLVVAALHLVGGRLFVGGAFNLVSGGTTYSNLIAYKFQVDLLQLSSLGTLRLLDL